MLYLVYRELQPPFSLSIPTAASVHAHTSLPSPFLPRDETVRARGAQGQPRRRAVRNSEAEPWGSG